MYEQVHRGRNCNGRKSIFYQRFKHISRLTITSFNISTVQEWSLGCVWMQHLKLPKSTSQTFNIDQDPSRRFQRKIYLVIYLFFSFLLLTDKQKHCGQFFRQLSGGKETTLTGMNSYTCWYCEKCFSYLSNLNRHERTHTGEKPYKCKYCKKCYSQSSNCKVHERTHTGEKPYKCKHCEMCFGYSSAYKQHERTHTGEKPYSCQHCNKCFIQSSHCKAHERTHTGEKPYICKYCKTCFSKLSHCKEHERTHTGEKPHTCKHCNKSFTTSAYCKQHCERFHTGEKPYSRSRTSPSTDLSASKCDDPPLYTTCPGFSILNSENISGMDYSRWMISVN